MGKWDGRGLLLGFLSVCFCSMASGICALRYRMRDWALCFI